MPFKVLTLWIVIAPDESVNKLGIETYYNILYFSRTMLYLNSAVNPILYNLMSSKFRDGFLLVCHMKKKSQLKNHRRGGRDRLGTFRTTSTSCTTSSSVSRQSTLKNTLYKKCSFDRSHSVVEHPTLISKSPDLNSRIIQSDLNKLRLKSNIAHSDPKTRLTDQRDDIIIEEEANSIIDRENSIISNANNLKRTKSLLRVFRPFKIRRQNSEPVQQKPLILANDQNIVSKIDVLNNTKDSKLPSKQRVISNTRRKSGYFKKAVSSEDLPEQIDGVPENQEITERDDKKTKKETNETRNRPGVSSVLVKQRSLDSKGYSANHSLRRSVILKSAKNISFDEREFDKLKGPPESYV